MHLPSPRLYWRIFALLLVAQVVIAVGSVALTLLVHRAFDRPPVDWAAKAAEAGVSLRDGGVAGLRDWQISQYRAGFATFVVDADGNSVDGTPLPPPFQHWVLMTPGDQLLRREGPPGRGDEIQVPIPDDLMPGHRLVALSERGFPSFGEVAYRIGSVVVVAMILIAIMTLFLARSLARPIIDLRRVTQSVAAGEYSKRVGVGALSRQDELGEQAADFDAMAERIQEQFEAQRQLFRDVSHELKSPLARLQLAIELLHDDADDNHRRWLPRLDKEAQALASMLDRILLLAQVDPGSVNARKSAVDLAPILESLVADARFEAHRKGQTIRCSANGSAVVRGNQMLLTSAIENVIRNAVSYGRADSEVSVELEVADGKAGITVTNRGESLRASDLQRIFEPFYRVPGDRTGTPAGQGIGLAITRSVAQAHKGTVTAGNHPEGGLIVRLVLPVGGAAPAV